MNILRDRLGVNDGTGQVLFQARECGGVPANTCFLRQLKKNARYVNGQKMKRWQASAGVYFPFTPLLNASGNRIYTDADLVKLREARPTLCRSGRGETAAPGGIEKARRFAALPSIEADNSLWFGEGKELPGIDGTESVDAAARKQLRDSVLQWAKNHFGEKPTVDNADTGWTVAITPKGIKDTLHHGFDGLLARSVPFIPQLVESGIHLDSIEKKPGLMSHIFANRIRLDGQEYVVGFVLREDGNGNRFYDHELTDIINPDQLKPVKQREAAAELQTDQDIPQITKLPVNQGDVISILRDRLGVNDGTGQVFFQARECGAPAVVVRGDELGVPDGADIREYIAAAKTYHDALKDESEHGRPVMQPQLERPVRFSRKGWFKNKSNGANIEKWKLFPKLREIIETSTLKFTEELNKKRADDFVRFHWVENVVELDGTPRLVGVMLAEDSKGNLFDNLNADVEGWRTKKGDPSSLPADSNAGVSGSPIREEPKGSSTVSMLPENGDGVNPAFLSGPAGGRSAARG